MSLINDALKKAARQRAEELADVASLMPGGGHGRVSKQRGPMRTQTLVLMAGAAVGLIVVSAVITGIFMTSRPEQKPLAAVKPQPEAPAPQAPPKVVVQTPPKVVGQAPPIVVSVPRPTPPASTSTPVASAKPAAPPALASVPVAESAPASQAIAAVQQSHSELVQGAVDRLRVSGVRSSGADSKALIDGHVYKLNEVIDHTLGLKLVKVDPDHLTFVDRDGGIYIRSL